MFSLSRRPLFALILQCTTRRYLSHRPVLLDEVVRLLLPDAPRENAVVIDATFGDGGHSRALLSKLGPGARLLAIDRDPVAVERAKIFAAEDARVCVGHGPFSEVLHIANSHGIREGDVDAVLFDFGVSSMQLDDPSRGFSFKVSGPLDMRMGSMEADSGTAADLVNSMSQDHLEAILRDYGEEKQARAIARAIVSQRSVKPFVTTEELARVVRSAVRDAGSQRIDPATRTFQALRIIVNDEMREIERALPAASSLLRVGGRLATISFHGLEDALVKAHITRRAVGNAPFSTWKSPIANAAPKPVLQSVTRGHVAPSEAEVGENRRARSARMRVAERIA